MVINDKNAENYNCHYPDATHCAGSRCMAWRWAYNKVLKTTDVPDAPALEWFESVQSTTHGYCGLAGRP